jgi:hypothetical protein
VTVPRLLSPLVRTRVRLACTLVAVPAVLVAASVPFWPHGGAEPRTQRDSAVDVTPVALGPKDENAAMTEAATSGKDVLVDKATSATSQTWALPDGKLRTTISAGPQRAKNSQGQWAPIDTKLTLTGKTVQPGNTPAPVRFSAGETAGETAGGTSAETVLAEMDLGGRTVTYTWPGPLPKPVLEGNRALYPEVLSGVDLLLVARAEGGFGQLLIVKTAAATPAVRALRYGLRSDGVVFRHDKTTGGVRLLDAKTKAEVSSIPTPLAWDSSGRDPESPETPRLSVATSADVLKLSGLSGMEPGVRQAPMPTRLEGDGTGRAVLHLDAAATGLLTDKKARFPLFLDPTMNGGDQAWALVHKPNPNSNFLNGTGFNGGTSDARVGYETDSNGLARSFWRMAFDSKIKGAEIDSASFKVLNNHSWSCTNREFQLWHTGPISSGTTWNKQPSWITLQQKLSFAHGYNSSCSDDYVAFNVRGAAQVAADAGASNLTLGMRASSEGDTLTWRKFQASTAELTAVYNRAPKEPTGGTTSPGGACTPGPGNGVTIAKTNIVLSATATDPDGNLSKLRFRWWKTGATVPDGTLVTPTSAGKATVTIPTASLTDKATYSWDVRSEDQGGLVSSFFPGGTTEPCRFTVDASAPPAPDIDSPVFLEATSDGTTWSTVKFGGTGPITFTAAGASKFTYSFEYIDVKTVTASSGKATVPDLKPRHSGPTTVIAYAYDAAGNVSAGTTYSFYVPPRDAADGPGDTGGDGRPDLLVIDGAGNLRTLPGDTDGELFGSLASAYSTGGKLNPTGHWYDPATGKAALIAKHSDAYPGDGVTDLFARTPDGGFWLYPGDGYGSFNVDQRLKVLLPSNTPAPSTWTQLKAVGDINGDKLPDLALRSGSAFWILSGYTGGSFQTATLMEGTAWATSEIVNIADVDLDTTPDLVWRNVSTGVMYLRHGKPGTVAGSVTLDSLKTAAASRQGDVSYGTNWTGTAITAVIGVPDTNGDSIPDMWARFGADGQTRVYHPTKTNTGAPVKVILTSDWTSIKGFA